MPSEHLRPDVIPAPRRLAPFRCLGADAMLASRRCGNGSLGEREKRRATDSAVAFHVLATNLGSNLSLPPPLAINCDSIFDALRPVRYCFFYIDVPTFVNNKIPFYQYHAFSQSVVTLRLK